MRAVFIGFLLCAATCDTGPGPANPTLTTPTTPGPGTINGTLDCEDPIEMPLPGQGGLPECVVHELQCGDVVQGSNADGTATYDWEFWNDAMALGQLSTEPRDILDGPEAIYAITGQDDTYDIQVTVQSCVQLWPSWRRHGDVSGDWCLDPGASTIAGHFTGDWRNKSYTLINRAAGVYDWEIIVDSWEGQTGNFTITVECF